MRPARRSGPLYVAVLLAVGLVVGRLLPPLAVRVDGGSPPVPGWGAAIVLGAGAITVGALAWHTWLHLHRRKRRMTADHAIRLLALAKAAIMVGGVFAGGYAGYALAFADSDSPLGQARFDRSLVAAGAAVALLIAALVLEWACRLPVDGEDKEKDTSRADPSPA